ncbi:MAG: hypothetical protein ACRD2M_00585 [Terriglobales bacterium]
MLSLEASVRGLSAATLLHAWENAREQFPAQWALTLLAAALPQVPPDQLALLSIGRRDACLLVLREKTFGPALRGFQQCAECRCELEFTLATPDLRAGAPAESGEGEHGLAVGEFTLQFRLLNSRDLLSLLSCRDVEQARRALLACCVLEARRGGAIVPPEELPAEVVSKLSDRLLECDPQAEILLGLRCPACGSSFRAVFDIGSFLWAEISAQARHLLRQVHWLAAAYGWREDEILAMSAARRQLYLEMIGQ